MDDFISKPVSYKGIEQMIMSSQSFKLQPGGAWPDDSSMLPLPLLSEETKCQPDHRRGTHHGL
jgi:hypothetical protein